MIIEEYWKRWDESLFRTQRLNLDPSFGPEFVFKDVSQKEIENVTKTIKVIFSNIIKKRDSEGISREITRLDCTRLSYEIHRELKRIGIRSILVTGDYSYCGDLMYEVTEKYIFDQIGHISSGMGLHTWLVLDNFLLIDPTRMIFHEKTKFESHEIIGEPLIFDLEEMHSNLFYIPFILGEEYLFMINALEPMINKSLPSAMINKSLPSAMVKSVSRPEVSRNSPCPCNSGAKYKHCCGELT
ncbi:YecA family protein [Vibrio jasicida]|uniref:YecA family protein n=1 Tax=Vibrio jasicida TaxID=766224 RepID=UPI003909BCF1